MMPGTLIPILVGPWIPILVGPWIPILVGPWIPILVGPWIRKTTRDRAIRKPRDIVGLSNTYLFVPWPSHYSTNWAARPAGCSHYYPGSHFSGS